MSGPLGRLRIPGDTSPNLLRACTLWIDASSKYIQSNIGQWPDRNVAMGRADSKDAMKRSIQSQAEPEL